MSTRRLQQPISSFTDGLNTEAEVLTVLPSEFMDGTVNVELLRNGSARRRRGVDFFGSDSSGDFMHTIRTAQDTLESFQESPGGIQVKITAPNGDLLERIILDINNTWLVFEVDQESLTDFSNPLQTITRTNKAHANQKWFNMQYAASGDRIYFAGRHVIPGYLSVDTDNVSLTATYYDVDIRDPSTEASLSNVITVYDSTVAPTATDTYPTTVDFFAGRVWLGGDPKNSNVNYFSQGVVSDEDLSKFYQESDPNGSDPAIVDDDGGRIALQGGGQIQRLLSFNQSIFAFTSENVWQISGPDGVFKANNFSVNKVLEDGISSPLSVVKTPDSMVMFGEQNIWEGEVESSISVTTAGRAEFKPISEDKIDTLYDDIPPLSRAHAFAVYDPGDRVVHYFFNNSVNTFQTGFGNRQPGFARNVLTYALGFHKSLENIAGQENKRAVEEAFTFHELADTATDGNPYVAGAFVTDDIPTSSATVTVDGEIVISDSETVVSSNPAKAKKSVTCIFMQRSGTSTVTIKAGLGKFRGDTAGQDWASDSNSVQNFDSTLNLGIQTMGDVRAKKAATYVMFVWKKVETGTLDPVTMIDITPGGALLRTAWNFATSTEASKFGSQQQIYPGPRFTYSVAGDGDDGFSHYTFKHRARGRGNALQYIITNDGTKDFHLIGWVTQFYGKIE